MKCNSCGANVKESWKYCARCGSSVSRRFNIGDIFSKMRKEMDMMTGEMDREMEAFDISPFFKKPKGSGFTIKIRSGTGMEPKVEVKTFGNVDSKVKEKIGKFQKSKLTLPKTTQEPPTEVRREGNRVIVDMELKGVKEENIEVNDLESSVEVRAVVGDRGFFKILTKPEQFKLVGRKFHGNKLHLEFA